MCCLNRQGGKTKEAGTDSGSMRAESLSVECLKVSRLWKGKL